MRIIAGMHGGRVLRSPAGREARPTTDRVREAWFNILGDGLKDAKVVDLFAGSGALGLEALSRGAASVEFVESSKRVLDTLRANVDELDEKEKVRIHRKDALLFVERLPATAFDVALADPPYNGGQAERIGAMFRARPFARVLSVEHRKGLDVGGDETRSYGDTSLTFYYTP